VLAKSFLALRVVSALDWVPLVLVLTRSLQRQSAQQQRRHPLPAISSFPPALDSGILKTSFFGSSDQLLTSA
jgi:hypothetical protein